MALCTPLTRARTGATIWRFARGGQQNTFTSITLSAKFATIFARSASGDLLSFDTATGQQRWVVSATGMTVSPIVGGDGTIYGSASAITARWWQWMGRPAV